MKKNILIISATFYPMQSPRTFRTTELAKEFALQGHKVDVLVPRYGKDHDEFEEKHPGISIIDIGSADWKNFELKGHKILILLKRFANRIANLLFEFPNIQFYFLTRKALKARRGYDALISIAVPFPIHWGVASVWNNHQKIASLWIADCGDPFMYGTHDIFKKMFYFHFFENNFLKKADFITVPFEEMKLLFNPKFKSKFRAIPQGFKFDFIDTDLYAKNTVPTIGFSGTIMPGSRDPFALIDYLIMKNTNFVFVCYVHQPQLFNKYSKMIGKNIFLKEYVPHSQLIKELSKMDFLVNVNTDPQNGKINAVPTKLIDYRLSGRPILSYEQSTLPIQIIDEFLEGNYTNAFTDQNFDRYKIENVAEQFLNLIK